MIEVRKKTIAVHRHPVTKEYIMNLIEMVHSEEMQEVLKDTAKDMNETFDEQYYLGTIAGFNLAIF